MSHSVTLHNAYLHPTCTRLQHKVFETFDADGSGEIDVEELYTAMKAMNMAFNTKADGACSF